METHVESIQEETIVKPFRVSVEGNIGAGKSTFINHFGIFPDVDIHMVSKKHQVSQTCFEFSFHRSSITESQIFVLV